ncbi:MAG: transketolase [Spirochaetes bacterium]|nr:transketolase [Spirochaetota bacterium]
MKKQKEYETRKTMELLLAIKDSDIRIMTLEQCKDAVDRGIHSGGACSATIPLVALFYGGIIDTDVAQPTRRGNDIFVLSKGHTVAPMASIYADLGYFSYDVLKNSRSEESILNGHPGPILPGVHVSTGPLGQGLSVSAGFALVGKKNPGFDVFCLNGDGELQEGLIWEGVMFAGHKKLDNLCMIVDMNYGQLDRIDHLVLPLDRLSDKFISFGWKVHTVDGTQYPPVLDALETFKFGPRDGMPTAVICRSYKGYGGLSSFMSGHKIVIDEELMEQEIILQKTRREARIKDLIRWIERHQQDKENVLKTARAMNITIRVSKKGPITVTAIHSKVRTKPAPPLDKRIVYERKALPAFEAGREYSASGVIEAAMKVFAKDPRVVSIDSDLASTSGLQAGVGFVDVERALNVGVAEANMMNIGEAYAAMGHNVWVSTFCPFFDWKVMRRIAIGQQERIEAMKTKGAWLTEGHGLDLTFVATAPNFETKTNGATHMGNDDITIFDGMAHLKIIDVSCPVQLLGVMRWIMEGNRGLCYVRILRSPAAVLYDERFVFEYEKGYIAEPVDGSSVVFVSSGRGVYEAKKAAILLGKKGVKTGVVDMPSIDETLFLELYESGRHIVVAEQNNGRIWTHFMKTLFEKKQEIDTSRLHAVNTLDGERKPQFIHSATYNQLTARFGLSAEALAGFVSKKVNKSGRR